MVLQCHDDILEGGIRIPTPPMEDLGASTVPQNNEPGVVQSHTRDSSR